MKKFLKKVIKYLGIFIVIILVMYFILTRFLNGFSNLYDTDQIVGHTFESKVIHLHMIDKIHFYKNGNYIRVQDEDGGLTRLISKGKYKINKNRTISLTYTTNIEETFSKEDRKSKNKQPISRKNGLYSKTYEEQYEIKKHYLRAISYNSSFDRSYPSKSQPEKLISILHNDTQNYRKKYDGLSGKSFVDKSSAKNYISFKNNKFLWHYEKEISYDYYKFMVIEGDYKLINDKLKLWNIEISYVYNGHYDDIIQGEYTSARFMKNFYETNFTVDHDNVLSMTTNIPGFDTEDLYYDPENMDSDDYKEAYAEYGDLGKLYDDMSLVIYHNE